MDVTIRVRRRGRKMGSCQERAFRAKERDSAGFDAA